MVEWYTNHKSTKCLDGEIKMIILTKLEDTLLELAQLAHQTYVFMLEHAFEPLLLTEVIYTMFEIWAWISNYIRLNGRICL